MGSKYCGVQWQGSIKDLLQEKSLSADKEGTMEVELEDVAGDIADDVTEVIGNISNHFEDIV